ncbi:MAG: hypothetical protein IJI44_00320 [Erysipelotrichaceae bacterium]|nr:hypothetical protein [Erysipelotrichaceae bacterium]
MKNIIIVVLFILLVIYILISFIGSALVQRKIRELYLNEKYDEYLEYLDSRTCRIYVRDNEIEEYKYKVYLKRNDREHIDEYFNKMLNRKVDRNTKLQYQIKAFYYYMVNNGADRCKELFEEIKAYGDEDVTRQVNYLYEIVVLKKGDYIEELKKILKEKENDPFYEYVLSVSYENIGDMKNAKKYKRTYKEHMKA